METAGYLGMLMRLQRFIAWLIDLLSDTLPASVSERKYMRRLELHSTCYSYAFQGIRSLWRELGEDPSLRMSKDWYSKMVGYLASVWAEGDSIRAIRPPSHLRDIHGDWIAASDHFDRYVYLMVEALATGSAAKLEEAYSQEQLGRGCVVRALAKSTRRAQETIHPDRL